jgi:hypothetical protein
MDCFAEPVSGRRVRADPLDLTGVVPDNDCYLFALRFLVVFFFAPFFGGTFFPSRRASESPIAIACLRLLTFFPDRPLFRVPAFRFFIARPTLADAFLEYFRAIALFSWLNEQTIAAKEDGSIHVPWRRAAAQSM